MASFAEYSQFDALGLAELIDERKLTALEILEAAISQIERTNPALNAVISTFYDRAYAKINQGLPSGPLSGVPFLLKDFEAHLAGTPLTNGSRLFEGYVSNASSTIVERYEAAGLVIIGKTNTPELGLSPATEPLFTGSTRNPWNLKYSPAGSSGGSGAAVAARMVPAAHATDGGGSIRAPASACGTVGLKPTRGRTPYGPFAREGWGGLSAGHVVSRSVRDTAALLDATHGPATGDPYAAPAPLRPFLNEIGADPGQLRIAVSTRYEDGPETDPACEASTFAVARLCESLGHALELATPSFSMQEIGRTNVVISAHIRLAVEERSRSLGREPSPDDVEPLTWKAMQFAGAANSTDYAAALASLNAVCRRVASFFEQYDVLLTPTMAKPPLLLGTLRNQSDEYAVHRSKVRDYSPFTGIFNVTGQPAISLPLGWTGDGLPIGVQLASAFGREDILLRLSSQLEAATPWACRAPSLAVVH